MATTINILCPNGRRQNVKVAPNETILQLLEKVCAKQGFEADEYGLKHLRTVLDVSAIIRYAGLPNHAKLEMIKLDRPRSAAPIQIAVQLENGERLQHEFLSETNLFDVLSHWPATIERPSLTTSQQLEGVVTHPVCVYMRKEIIGEAWLKATTLKSLGLTSGKAILRHMFRAIDLPPAPKPQVGTKTGKQCEGTMTSTQNAINKMASTTSIEKEQLSAVSVSDSQVSSSSSLSFQSKTDAASKNNQETLPVSMTTGVEPMDTSNTANLGTHSPEETFEKVSEKIKIDQDVGVSRNTEERGGNSDVAMVTMSEEILMEVEEKDESTEKELPSTSLTGARPKELRGGETMALSQAGPSSSSNSSKQEKKTVETYLKEHGAEDVDLDARTKERIEKLLKKEEEMMEQMQNALLQATQNQMRKEQKQKSQVQEKRPIPALHSTSQPFRDFKFPEVPQQKPEEKEEMLHPCERHTLVFSTDDVIPTADQFQELSDDFFDVTLNDVRSMISGLKSEQVGKSEMLLETKSMREAKMKKKMERYEKVVVRIHFPNRLMLQGFFKPQEKVEALYDFVQKNVPKQQSTFYLYTTPPKEILKKKSDTLFEAKLCPAAVVYFGVESWEGPYLNEDTLSKKVSLTEADVKVARESSSSQLGSSKTQGESSTSQERRRRPMEETTPASSSSSQSTERKVPKWFKMGKK